MHRCPYTKYCQVEYSTEQEVTQHLGRNSNHFLDRYDAAIVALEFYANEKNYRAAPDLDGPAPIGDYPVFEDYGQRAREAIGAKPPEWLPPDIREILESIAKYAHQNPTSRERRRIGEWLGLDPTFEVLRPRSKP